MNLIDTLPGSLLENFFPAGWDLARIDACCSHPPESVAERQSFWNPRFSPLACDSLTDFDTMMGHEIALQIKSARDEGYPLALIMPVGPIGMYRWVGVDTAN